MQSVGEPFDYIIVGGGSAGCVLANRLSADPANRVLLLEAGPPDTSPLIRFPRGFVKLMADPKHCWHLPAEVSDRDTPEIWLRGKMLGGSSSINGMIYVRGQPQDYDGWAAVTGDPGWSWEEMSNAFRAIEDHALGADDVRGAGGLLSVEVESSRNEVCDAIIAAGAALGLPQRADVNRPDQVGIGYAARTMKKGKRHSAADAFLAPVKHRQNLTIITDALVDRVLFDDRRAVGVLARIAGREHIFRARGEVILSAGGLQSPPILQRSGIGDGALLSRLGIGVVSESPDVGRNLYEHRPLPMQFRLRRNIGLNRHLRGAGLALSAMRYALGRRGPFALPSFDVCAFFSTDGSGRADAQVLVTPLTLDQNERLPVIEKEGGVLFIVSVERPTSAGTLAISSAAPDAPLAIDAQYFTTDYDRQVMARAVRFVRQMVATEPLAGLVSHETHPGADIESDEALLQAAARAGYTGYHATSTCRMGADNRAVVDSRLRVRGVDGLRVIDTSVIPSMVSGNTNGPVMALAWRAADFILAGQ
jgi:choline dehydrogenase